MLAVPTLSSRDKHLSRVHTSTPCTYFDIHPRIAVEQGLAAAAQLAEGGLLSGLLGDFCHSFHTISLYWFCFRPGFSSFSSGSMESEKVAKAAFTRLVGTA